MDRVIVHPELDGYLTGLVPARPPVVQEMERHAVETRFPMVGPLVGRLLLGLGRMVRARRVLELGSGFGYSAYWFAEAVGQGGEVVLTDGSQERSDAARVYLDRLGLAERCRFEVGDALAIARRAQGPFDLVFCDIDKEGYPEVPELALPLLRPGGLLVFDNTLWSGRVADAEPADAATRAVQKLNTTLATRPDVITFIVPLRDGVSVSLKL